MEHTLLLDRWMDDFMARLDSVIDAAQRSHNGESIETAGRLLVRFREAGEANRSLERELEALESLAIAPPIVAQPAAASTEIAAARTTSRRPFRRPPSFLILPAGGDDSSRHYQDTVEEPVDPDRLDEWLPGDAAVIRSRITNRLAAWGLRDNTRLRTTDGAAPLIWDRIYEHTLALFSDGQEYICAARVIGKGRSDPASAELWDSPEFRWLILLTDVTPTRVPLRAVMDGAGFNPTYRINRQAIVPKPYREAGLWKALQRYGVGDPEKNHG